MPTRQINQSNRMTIFAFAFASSRQLRLPLSLLGNGPRSADVRASSHVGVADCSLLAAHTHTYTQPQSIESTPQPANRRFQSHVQAAGPRVWVDPRPRPIIEQQSTRYHRLRIAIDMRRPSQEQQQEQEQQGC